MDLLLEFANKGQIGPVHLGMPIDEVEHLLGPGHPHPAIRLLGPDADGYPYTWGNLELRITRRSVSEIRFTLRPGSTFSVPAELWTETKESTSTVSREGFLAVLEDAQCEYEVYDSFTIGPRNAVRARGSGVVATFEEFSKSEDLAHGGLYLTGVYKTWNEDMS